MSVNIHPSSDIQSSHIGSNTVIWQFVVILKGAVIGANCNINCHCFIENDVVVGNKVTIKSGVYLWDGLRIEDEVFIGPNVTFTNDSVPRSKAYPEQFDKTIVKRGASIGANATIKGGITIGEYAMIGAGSVVTKDIPPYTVWYGNPAMHRGYISAGGDLLNMDLKSKATGASYQLIDNTPIKST